MSFLVITPVVLEYPHDLEDTAAYIDKFPNGIPAAEQVDLHKTANDRISGPLFHIALVDIAPLHHDGFLGKLLSPVHPNGRVVIGFLPVDNICRTKYPRGDVLHEHGEGLLYVPEV